VLDPDSAPRAASPHTGGPGIVAGEASPHALQILTTEHWSLLASRQLGYTEAMSRTSIFIAALSGAVVALALVAQATDFGDGFVAFALVLLPVVFFLGIVTIARLSQVNREEAVWVQGLNRLRHAYLELAPELEPYFVTSRYDDDAGVLRSSIATPRVQSRLQGFIAIPGVVAVLDSVVAGATVGIAALGLDLGTGAAIAAGAITFAAGIAASLAFFLHVIAAHRRDMIVRFPTPPSGDEHTDDRRAA
jgi:hypothetical protein